MLAAREVGGDFYDVLRLENGRIGLSVADVSDKGIPAALFMMSALTLLKGSAIGVGAPGAVLTEVNDLLNEENEAAMFVTLLYAVFDPSNGLLNYANGGHNPPIIVHPDGTSTLLPATGGIALGVAPKFPIRRGFRHPGPRGHHSPIHRRRHRGYERRRRRVQPGPAPRSLHQCPTPGILKRPMKPYSKPSEYSQVTPPNPTISPAWPADGASPEP